MSIKVKVGASKSIRSVPKQSTTRPIVAPGEKKPVIVPDSIVLGIDTIGPYVATIDAGPGIVVSPEVNNETANLVISHVNSSDEANTVNDIFGFVRNVDIDQFGHVTRFYNTGLDPLNFTANGTFLSAKDITLGNTSLTIGESSNSIEGLSLLNVGDVNLSSNRITALEDLEIYLEAGKLIISSNIVDVNSTGGFIIPSGTTLDRPLSTAKEGMIRYNTTDSQFEGYDGTVWKGIGGVIDIDQDTKIIAESSPGINNDQLQFFTAGFERLRLDADGSFKFGESLNKVVIQYDTGNTVFTGTVLVNDQTTLSSVNVLNLDPGSIVFASANGAPGQLETSDQLLWDGLNLVIKGGISVDGDFSTSGGLSGDSLSVGNLSANTIVFIGEGGVLQSNTSLTYDGFEFTLQTPATFEDDVIISSLSIDDLTQNRIVVVGPEGKLRDDQNLTWTGSALVVDANVNAATVNVRNLSTDRIVLGGEDGALIDSPKLLFNGNTFFVDGDANITGDITIGGNITIGDQQVDTINVVADFTSNLIPRDDNTYVIGRAGRNWNAVYTRRLHSDDGIIRIDIDGAIGVPSGNTAVRPTPASTGMLRFNTTDVQFEGYDGSVWKGLGGVIDVDQDTKIIAETSPGADNDELEFYTAGERRFYISNVGVITTDADVDLSFDIGGIINVGNTIITGVASPIDGSDAVSLEYLENDFQSSATVNQGSNNYTIELLDNPTLELGKGLEVSNFSSANNSIRIGLNKPSNAFEPNVLYGRDGFNPRFRFDDTGRVVFASEVPLELQAGAIVDFSETTEDLVADFFTRGGTNAGENGITIVYYDANDTIDFIANDFDINLIGDVTGSARVNGLSNTTITTTYDYTALDNRYLNVTGDTATGDIAAPKFIDSANTIYFAQPSSTSRFRSLLLGFGQTESILEMKDSEFTSAYLYAGTFSGDLQIGFLNDSFNFAAYANRSTSNWVVRNDVIGARFVDRNNTTYFVNPASTDTRIRGMNIDQTIVIDNVLTISAFSLSTPIQDLILNPGSGEIDANTSIIKNVSDPINNRDAVNKQFLTTELNNLSNSGIRIAAETGSTDTVRLGEIITFAAGEGINTVVSNNQILIEGELANNTNVGVASFSASNFAVSIGGEVTVTILDGGSF